MSLDNKQIIHIAAELVVLTGLTFYFSSKNGKLKECIEDLAQRLEEQENRIQKLEQANGRIASALQQLMGGNYVPGGGRPLPPLQKPKNLKPPQKPKNVPKNTSKKGIRSSPVQPIIEQPSIEVEPESDLDEEIQQELNELEESSDDEDENEENKQDVDLKKTQV